MNNQTIVCCVVALLLGMLLANMLKSVCGCKLTEGQGCVGAFDAFAVDIVNDDQATCELHGGTWESGGQCETNTQLSFRNHETGRQRADYQTQAVISEICRGITHREKCEGAPGRYTGEFPVGTTASDEPLFNCVWREAGEWQDGYRATGVVRGVLRDAEVAHNERVAAEAATAAPAPAAGSR
jgi:hypothetical protein